MLLLALLVWHWLTRMLLLTRMRTTSRRLTHELFLLLLLLVHLLLLRMWPASKLIVHTGVEHALSHSPLVSCLHLRVWMTTAR